MPDTETKPVPETAHRDYMSLLSSFQSIQMATRNASNKPEVSYAPAVIDDERRFFVYVSELATHTASLLNTEIASIMVIEDESMSSQIFARKRVTFQCEAQLVVRASKPWEDVMARFEEKFGNVVSHLKTMQDFHLVRLIPINGRLVLGFGQAYDVTGEKLEKLEHVGGLQGQGHRSNK